MLIFSRRPRNLSSFFPSSSLAARALFFSPLSIETTHLRGLHLEGLPGDGLALCVLVELQLGALERLARLAEGRLALVGERGAGAGHGDQREESDGLGGHHCRRF